MNIPKLRTLKQEGKKFSVIAAYDATFARVLNAAGVDAILVGDSLAMVVQGNASTLQATLDDMAYHTEAVVRGNSDALIIADMPFMSYHNTEMALEHAGILMRAGANMVKLEGGQWLADTVARLVEQGIPVCAHIGLTPQSVNKLGGYKVQGRDADSHQQILSDAIALDNAGADFIVLECVPSELAKDITSKVTMSTIGIGAGPDTDAQVLVAHDALGLSPYPARFVRDFLADTASIEAAFRAYDEAVKAGTYPASEHEYH